MIVPRLRGVAIVGFAVALLGTAALPVAYVAAHSSGALNSHLIEVDFVSLGVLVITGALAGVTVCSREGVRVSTRVWVGALAGIAALCVGDWVIGTVGSTDNSLVLCTEKGVIVDCPSPADYAWILLVIGLMFFVAAAAVYWIAAKKLGVPRGRRLLVVAFLLLAVVPVASVVAFVVLLATTGRDSTRPRVAAGRTA